MPPRLLVPLHHPLDLDVHGSKATRLARVAALGATVPPSLVVPVDFHGAALARAAFGEPPRASAALRDALARELNRLGPPPWVARTSAATEDLPGASAAGLYYSELGLGDPAGVVAAVQRCWRAAHTEALGLYLTATGRQGQSLPTVAILIQRQERARWAGVLFTRDPREGPASAHLRCELARASTAGVTAGLVDPVAHTLDRHGGGWPALPSDAGVSGPDLVALAALAEEAVGGPADVELALTPAGPVVLQVRPITAWSPGGGPPAERQEDGLVWRWDAEHNPAPLSPLHASLVARLDRNPALPFRLRCVGGYLYHAPRPGSSGSPGESPTQVQQAWPARQRQLERMLETLEALEQVEDPGEALARALAAFDSFYEHYATLAGTPLGSSHRQLASQLDDRLARGELRDHQLHETLTGVVTPLTSALGALAQRAAAHPGLLGPLAQGRDVSGEPGGAALEEALARMIARLGALPPAWDLAAPTLGESPATLRRAVAALARSQPVAQPTPTDPHLDNLAADEEDDLLFARGLAVLRRACLRAGERLAREERLDRAEDVFRLRLPTLLEGLAQPGAATDLRARLARKSHHLSPARSSPAPLRTSRALGNTARIPGGRGRPQESRVLRDRTTPGEISRLARKSHHLSPARSSPGEISGLAPVPGKPNGATGRAGPLRGFGTGGGVVQARALVVEHLERDLLARAGQARGRIVVCASLLPSAVVLLAGAAGIVTDHGGLLSHGAILARELGLPAVLGTRSATTSLRTGDRLWLDATQGVVIQL